MLNRLDQYQYLYRLYCNFWKAWVQEYLHQLQPRSKWNEEYTNAVVGQIVLIADNNLPPSRELFGKIVNIHSAKDGLVRCVDVLCQKTVLSRPIHKLALLPIIDNQQLEQAQRGEVSWHAFDMTDMHSRKSNKHNQVKHRYNTFFGSQSKVSNCVINQKYSCVHSKQTH